MTSENTLFWGSKGLSTINVLFQKDKLQEFFPTRDMSLERRLNALSRLIIYISLIFSFYQGNTNFIIYGIIALTTICLWYNLSSKKTRDNLDDQSTNTSNNNLENYSYLNNYKGTPKKPIKREIVKPSTDNPFMNVMPDTYKTAPNCISQIEDDKVSYNEVQEDIDDKFNQGLFREVSDIYGRANSQRQFYTMPNTSIPNDQEQFAEWLYKTPPTCKEGNGLSCEKNNAPVLVGNLSQFC